MDLTAQPRLGGGHMVGHVEGDEGLALPRLTIQFGVGAALQQSLDQIPWPAVFAIRELRKPAHRRPGRWRGRGFDCREILGQRGFRAGFVLGVAVGAADGLFFQSAIPPAAAVIPDLGSHEFDGLLL